MQFEQVARRRPLRKKSDLTASTTPETSRQEIHSHASFLYPMAAAVVLLLVASVLAYTSWARGADLASMNLELESENSMLTTENAQLTHELAVATVPFFYTQPDANSSAYNLVEVNVQDGSEEIVYTSQDFSIMTIYAIPRVGFDGTIVLRIVPDGTEPIDAGFNLFNSKTKKLTPIPIGAELPFLDAITLSPDETHISAIYDNPNMGETSRELKVWNLITGKEYILDKLGDSERFALHDNVFGGSGGYNVKWLDRKCLTAQVFQADNNPNVPNAHMRFVEHCIQ